MTDNDRTTINVSKDAHRTAKAAKRQGESWTDYLLRCVDEPPGADAEAIAAHLADTLDALDREALATDRQEQLETTINGMCGDHATEEAVGELAEEIRKAQELAEQARDNTDELLREVR